VREIIDQHKEAGKQYFPFGNFLVSSALSKPEFPDREIQPHAGNHDTGHRP
jgi:hypothetical protein